MDSNEAFRTAIAEHAVLLALDAEKGEGKELATQHKVGSFPTFILTNQEGEVLDRWVGWGGVESFLSTLGEATTDPLTLPARLDRFRAEPNATDARKIGKLRRYEGYTGEAMAWFDRAEGLDPALSLAFDRFGTVVDGHRRSGLYDLAAVGTHGRAVLNGDGVELDQIEHVLGYTEYLARNAEDRAPYISTLQAGAKVLATMEGDDARRQHAAAMAGLALEVDGDAGAAFAWKKKSLPEGWDESPDQLNSIAWWCFENEVGLDEAEAWARRGVELAEPGAARGQILDTLAEICNLTGDCGEAVELMRQAVEEDPSSEYYKKQLARFEKLLEEQKAG